NPRANPPADRRAARPPPRRAERTGASPCGRGIPRPQGWLLASWSLLQEPTRCGDGVLAPRRDAATPASLVAARAEACQSEQPEAGRREAPRLPPSPPRDSR